MSTPVNSPVPNQVATESKPNAVQFGYILPSDMRVRLVREEHVTLDSILTILYSTVLAVFGVFLGMALTKGQSASDTEIAGVVFLGIFAAVLLVWWIYNRFRRSSGGIGVPVSAIKDYMTQED